MAREGKGRRVRGPSPARKAVPFAALTAGLRTSLLAGLLAGLLVALVALQSCQASKLRVEERVAGDGGLRYVLYLPAGYGDEASRRWPMILFLHGAGESGSDLSRVRTQSLPALIEGGLALPFVVIAPQCPASSTAPLPGPVRDLAQATFSAPDMLPRLASLVAEAVRLFRVDPERVCLTGFSMGANGAWSLALAEPGLFSRLAPVSGCGLPSPEGAPALRGLPVWMFHGSADGTFPAEFDQASLAELRAAGGEARLTIIGGADHVAAANAAYLEPGFAGWAALPRAGLR